jgi:2-polyprenyl-3-methyl-5-hydroxy-6-metoxy-1,4-benzoquinol methylase
MLHHFDQPIEIIRACHRILAPGGVLLNRYGAIEDILDDPDHRFFPEVTAIDKLRTPSKIQMENWFRNAGFVDVSSSTMSQQTFIDPEQRIKAIQERHISALWMISDSAFEAGFSKARRHVESNSCDRSLLVDRITFTSGRK